MKDIFEGYPNTEKMYQMVFNNLKTNRIVGVTSVKAKELVGVGLIQQLLDTNSNIRIWVVGKDYLVSERFRDKLDKKYRGIKFISYKNLSEISVSSLEIKGYIANLIIFDDFDIITEDKRFYLSVKAILESSKKGFCKIVGLSRKTKENIDFKIKELFENNILDKLEMLNMKQTRNSWTNLEVSLLNEFYSIGGVKLCQEKGINRSVNSIRAKASQLKIKYKE